MGKIYEAEPLSEKSTVLLNHVNSGFISTIVALLSLAQRGNVLAGDTFNDVPITNKRLQDDAISIAFVQSF